ERASRGTDAARVKQIFMRDGYTVQRPTIAPFGQFAVALTGFGQSLLFGEGNQAMKCVALFDVGECLFDQLHAGDFPATQALFQFANVHEVTSGRGASKTAGST